MQKDRAMPERDLSEAVRAVLLREWDPIGIADEPAAQDEYDSYVVGVVHLIRSGATVEAVAVHLVAIEREQMGLAGNELVAVRVARRLVALA